MLSFKPALNGNIAVIQYINCHYDHANLYIIEFHNPYTLFTKGFVDRFYLTEKVKIKKLREVFTSQDINDVFCNTLFFCILRLVLLCPERAKSIV